MIHTCYYNVTRLESTSRVLIPTLKVTMLAVHASPAYTVLGGPRKGGWNHTNKYNIDV